MLVLMLTIMVAIVGGLGSDEVTGLYRPLELAMPLTMPLLRVGNLPSLSSHCKHLTAERKLSTALVFDSASLKGPSHYGLVISDDQDRKGHVGSCYSIHHCQVVSGVSAQPVAW